MAEAHAEKSLNLVFMGTPAFAADILQSLLDAPDVRVAACWTQPDKVAGRGKKLTPSPVKQLALQRGIPVFQPASLRSPEAQAEAVPLLKSFEPDFLVVAAYGMILPQAVLDVPKFAPVNVHTSLLPRYRGAAPVQRALMDGLEETGVSIMRIEAGLDTGPVYAQQTVSCLGENQGTLFVKLAKASGPLLLETLRAVAEGRAVEHPQDEALASYASKVTKQEGWIAFDRPAVQVEAMLRGLTPDPGAHVLFRLEDGREMSCILEQAELCAMPETLAAGEIWASRKKLVIGCAEGALSIRGIRPSGKKSMDQSAFINGLRLDLGQGRRIGGIAEEPAGR
ncbi:MAG: methionyl-tRNA formyltransferase [Desulfovibrio sp.]|nr:methionyl-tRNA formyltransferase [Desulfovibrio sp.]